MRRRLRGAQKTWIIALVVIPILMMSLTGVAFSHWVDRIFIWGTITTWEGDGGGAGACVSIQKTLYGAFTDPYTGKDTATPTGLVRVNSTSGAVAIGEIGCPPTNFPTKFKLCINVTNCGGLELTNVVVTDRLECQFVKVNCTKSDPTDMVTFVQMVDNMTGYKNTHIIWEVGNLSSGEWTTVCIWIKTSQNSAGLYYPTSVNQDYPVNIGAKVEAVSAKGNLIAQTEGIVIEIGDFVQPNIAEILTELPYSTPWANDYIDP